MICFLFFFLVLQLQHTLVEGLLLPFLYIHTCVIFNNCIHVYPMYMYTSRTCIPHVHVHIYLTSCHPCRPTYIPLPHVHAYLMYMYTSCTCIPHVHVYLMNVVCTCTSSRVIVSRRAKLGQIQGGGGCRGPSKIRQRGGGGFAIIFYFLRVKNITF